MKNVPHRHYQLDYCCWVKTFWPGKFSFLFQIFKFMLLRFQILPMFSPLFYDDLSLCHVHTTYTLGYSIRKLNKSRNSREETIKRRNEFNFIPLAFVASSLSSDRVSSAFASDPSQHNALLLQEISDIKNSNRDLNSLETSTSCYLPKNIHTQQLNSNPFQPSSTENVSPSINKQPRKFWTFSEATSTIVWHGDFLENKKKNLEFSLNLLLRVSQRSSKSVLGNDVNRCFSSWLDLVAIFHH